MESNYFISNIYNGFDTLTFTNKPSNLKK